MKKINSSDMTTKDLVDRFAQIGRLQDQALLGGQIAKFNRLFDQMAEISKELKDRPGDERSALMALYDFPNMQVRLKAAIHTLGIAPIEARRQLEAIAQSKWFPQAGDAGMALSNLDRGIFRPS
jgi:hypothetical protein